MVNQTKEGGERHLDGTWAFPASRMVTPHGHPTVEMVSALPPPAKIKPTKDTIPSCAGTRAGMCCSTLSRLDPSAPAANAHISQPNNCSLASSLTLFSPLFLLPPSSSLLPPPSFTGSVAPGSLCTPV
eukprot:2560736-Rhodomonas_salina.5